MTVAAAALDAMANVLMTAASAKKSFFIKSPLVLTIVTDFWEKTRDEVGFVATKKYPVRVLFVCE